MLELCVGNSRALARWTLFCGWALVAAELASPGIDFADPLAGSLLSQSSADEIREEDGSSSHARKSSSGDYVKETALDRSFPGMAARTFGEIYTGWGLLTNIQQSWAIGFEHT